MQIVEIIVAFLLKESFFYHKHQVDLEDLCYRFGKDAAPNPTNPSSSAVLETMKTNFVQNNQLYWQYFGTEEGVFVTYPSRKTTDCGNYDPRFRY